MGAGSRICKAAVSRGWDVTSIRQVHYQPVLLCRCCTDLRFPVTDLRTSRSGEPKWSSVTASPTAPSWSTSVRWHAADILKPATYTSELDGADAVVHSMGILLEADYKGVLQGKEPVWAGLQRAFSSTKQGSRNPLDQKPGQGAESMERDGQVTYELMNRDSGRFSPHRFRT